MSTSSVSSCGGDVSATYQHVTDWWSSEDQGILLTAGINCVVFTVACLCYACFSRSRWLKPVYAPLVSDDAKPHPLLQKEVIPFGDDETTLEHTMMQRFLKMNTRLLLLFALFAFPVLLPTYSINVYAGMDIDLAPPPPPNMPPSPPPQPPMLPGSLYIEPVYNDTYGGVSPLSGFKTLSLGHLPPGSPRYWASSTAMFILTILFLALTRTEFEEFVKLRIQWLSAKKPQMYAARLITSQHTPAPLGAGGGFAARPTGEAMLAHLKPLFGDGLADCLAVPRHPFWPGLVSKGLGAVEKGANKTSSATDKVNAGVAGDTAKTAMSEFKIMALGEDTETSYILLFRTRAARFTAVNSPSLLTNATIGDCTLSAHAKAAAAAEDYSWDSLSTPRWIVVLAWIGTILFFAFWNIPIAVAQVMTHIYIYMYV